MFYSKVEISKALEDKKQIINFYILEEENYGIKISITSGDNTEDKEIHDISKEKIKVENLIEELMNNICDLSQLQYIVEDYKANNKLIVA